MVPVDLRCEYLTNPLGIDVGLPRLSWTLDAGKGARRGQRQTAYQVQVADARETLSRGEGNVWDSGKVGSDATHQIAYAGQPLRSGRVYFWQVRAWDDKDQVSDWSAPAYWTMGLLHGEDWTARWIEAPGDVSAYSAGPCPMFRHEFNVEKRMLRRATLYVSALGVYEIRFNGMRVGDRVLAPEWTDYRTRVQYQTYDVTTLVKLGPNVLHGFLGDGWYAGRLGLQAQAAQGAVAYGVKPALLVQFVMEGADGALESVVSDGSWLCSLEGPIRSASLLEGEVFDARRLPVGWEKPGYRAAGWVPVVVRLGVHAKLVAQMNEPIHVVEELTPIAMTEPQPRVYVFDFGQNFSGRCRIRVRLVQGGSVTLRHGEMLAADGTLYRDNLRLRNTNRNAQTDVYTAVSSGEEIYEPRFTCHGFRYVEVTGLMEKPALTDLTGCVVHSGVSSVGKFSCSDPDLTKLFKSIEWTTRSNLQGIPTDCPQRDERLGWCGDAHVAAPTAMCGFDLAAFYAKWLRDIRDGQAGDGRFPDFAPHPYDPAQCFSGNPGWADAGVIMPWRLYMQYGDTRILQEQFVAARAWVDFVHRHNPDLIWKNRRSCGLEYGDWLNGDRIRVDDYPRCGAEAPRGVFATAFFALSADLVCRTAAVLGYAQEAQVYGHLAQRIRQAFNTAFVAADGGIEGDTQGGYVLALAFDLLPPELRTGAAAKLAGAVKSRETRLSTGIQTTGLLMQVLSAFGYDDLAWELLMRRGVPSWLHMIEQGATTIWERWDGYVPGRGMADPGMNSFNHCAFGAVGEWMVRNLVGLGCDSALPGFRRALIRPVPGGGVTWAEGTYDAITGRLHCRWDLTPDGFSLAVDLPVNVPGIVYIPAPGQEAVLEGGKAVAKAKGVTWLGQVGVYAVFSVEPGQYEFAVRPSA